MNEPTVEQAFETIRSGLSKKIAAKQKELASLRADIERKREKEEVLSRELAKIETAVSVIQGQFGFSDPESSALTSVDAHRLRTQTVAESALDVMRSQEGEAKVTEILALLLNAGKLKNYQSGYSTIKKTLDRDSRFRRVGPGVYGIAPPHSGPSRG